MARAILGARWHERPYRFAMLAAAFWSWSWRWRIGWPQCPSLEGLIV